MENSYDIDNRMELVLRTENAFTVEPPFRAAHAGLKPGATTTWHAPDK